MKKYRLRDMLWMFASAALAGHNFGQGRIGMAVLALLASALVLVPVTVTDRWTDKLLRPPRGCKPR